MIKFYYNGMKADDNPGLQKCWYSASALLRHPAGTFTLYARDYRAFSPEIAMAFKVENDTDIMTDYIQKDLIRVEPSHPLYGQIVAAFEKQQVHNAARQAKYLARAA